MSDLAELNVRVVLVNTTHPGNIGATARAMKTMGLHRLYLVSPKIFPHEQAQALASHANDLLEQAILVSTLPQAIDNCTLVFGTSNRYRDLSQKMLSADQSAQLIVNHYRMHEIAILFGSERTGLTNIEMEQCHYQITIPTNPNYASLNIAGAVQVIGYELRKVFLAQTELKGQKKLEYATFQEVENLYGHLEKLLWDVDFLKSTRSSHIPNRLRRLFNRTQLEKREVKILRGILTAIDKHII